MPVAVEVAEPIEGAEELGVEAIEAVEPPAEVEPEPAVASNGNGTRAVPAQFGATDDDAVDEAVTDELDTILDARTPLLQRACSQRAPSRYRRLDGASTSGPPSPRAGLTTSGPPDLRLA